MDPPPAPSHPGNASVTLVTNLITSGLNPLFIVSIFKMSRCRRHVSGTEPRTQHVFRVQRFFYSILQCLRHKEWRSLECHLRRKPSAVYV